MKFRVPQFIDVEDKIFGSLTLKQFFYVIGAGGTAYIIFKFIKIKIIALIIAVPISGFFLALAFVKINERSFIDFSESVFNYLIKSKVYIWRQPKQTLDDPEMAPLIMETTKISVVEKVNRDKLHEVAFGLDVLSRNPQNDDEK